MFMMALFRHFLDVSRTFALLCFASLCSALLRSTSFYLLYYTSRVVVLGVLGVRAPQTDHTCWWI